MEKQVKKLLYVICIITVVAPKLGLCETFKDPLTPRAPNTEIWDDFDVAFKTLLIGGLLVGFRSGIATGVESEHRKLKDNTDESIIEANKLIIQARSLFGKPVSYYVEQTDNFLRENPDCKTVKITFLLEQLAQVWASTPLKEHMGYDFTKELTYSNVERVCLEALP